MTTSNYITFILLGVIGLVFLIDFILNSRKKPLEKSVEKFVEKEKAKKKNWLNLKSFFWVYPISFLINIPFLIAIFLERLSIHGHVDILERFFQELDQIYTLQHLSFSLLFLWHFIFSLPVLLYYLNLKYSFGKWILKRKKNITLSLILIFILKILTHYFFYTEYIAAPQKRFSGIDYSRYGDQDFGYHMDRLMTHRIDLFIPVIIVFLVVVWFFNDKIKAR